ncbi:SOS response-associated peptidase [Halocatena halophila]|uniref:SOS response-associated peptidase n=1 Tax=Halocatena halophila TaxID=2814576 RepID=UPI002ED1A9A0
MCGRYSLFVDPAALEARFDAQLSFSFEPRYNAAPGQQLPTIRDDDADTIQRAHWGLVPSWADKRTTDHINARAETVSDRRMFADAYQHRRCLVPVDGFYEWSSDERSQPYRFVHSDGGPFALAGLWERWTPPHVQTQLDAFARDGPDRSAEELVSFTILTQSPTATVEPIHDRMPVVLSEATEQAWLSGDPIETLAPIDDDTLNRYPVSRAVNDPTNDTPAVVEAIDER